MKLVTADEMRALEDATFASGVSAAHLMDNAGKAVADAVRDRLGVVRGERIVILVGPGNNGGDGLVAARHLYDYDAEVTIFLMAPRAEDDTNLQLVRQREVEIFALYEGGNFGELDEALGRADAVLDAGLGTGRQRPLMGVMAQVYERLKHINAARFALDIPTGLDADTGNVDPHAAKMDVTLTLGFSKLGLHLLSGPSYTGELQVLDIGLLPSAAEAVRTKLITAEWVAQGLPVRPQESNKGTFGRLLVIAGSERYTGAAALTALAALRSGAGLVTLASVPQVRSIVAAMAPELTHLPLPDDEGAIADTAGDLLLRDLESYRAVVIGPGLGLSPGTRAVVRGLLTSEKAASIPWVIDADALNTLSRFPGWSDHVRVNAVLTPHPGELARLAGKEISDIQSERLTTARNLAQEWRQSMVLKGANTIVTDASGQAWISPFANAALATAGTGDVLSGVIGGLLAQGIEVSAAASLGVYLHGAAAESYRETYGESGLLASELLPAIARLAASLRRSAAR